MFGNEGWRWVGSPQPPTPGKVVALGDRAAGAGPLSAEWGRGGQGPEARAPRLRSGPGSPAAVSSAWIPDPPFLRPGRCLRPARPGSSLLLEESLRCPLLTRRPLATAVVRWR